LAAPRGAADEFRSPVKRLIDHRACYARGGLEGRESAMALKARCLRTRIDALVLGRHIVETRRIFRSCPDR